MLVEGSGLLLGNLLSLLLIAGIFSCQVSYRLARQVRQFKFNLVSSLPQESLDVFNALWPFKSQDFVNLLILVTLAVDVFAWVQYRTEVYRSLLWQEAAAKALLTHHVSGVSASKSSPAATPSGGGSVSSEASSGASSNKSHIGSLMQESKAKLKNSVLGSSADDSGSNDESEECMDPRGTLLANLSEDREKISRDVAKNLGGKRGFILSPKFDDTMTSDTSASSASESNSEEQSNLVQPQESSSDQADFPTEEKNETLPEGVASDEPGAATPLSQSIIDSPSSSSAPKRSLKFMTNSIGSSTSGHDDSAESARTGSTSAEKRRKRALEGASEPFGRKRRPRFGGRGFSKHSPEETLDREEFGPKKHNKADAAIAASFKHDPKSHGKQSKKYYTRNNQQDQNNKSKGKKSNKSQKGTQKERTKVTKGKINKRKR